MSLNSNSSVVTNGLVFNYDASNNKSYRSPPIRNILNQITPRGLSVSTLYNFSSGTENVYIPALGWINNCQYVDMYNDYNGGSNNCCPSPYGYGDGLVVSPSTLYTYAMVYKSTNGYTHPNYMYHYEFTSAGSYLTEYGVFGNNGSTAKIRSLGNDWYWASATFTSNASAGLMNTGSWMYEYGRFNRFHVAKVMLVPGNYIDMPPNLWPDLNTTVSNTQAILDLTSNNTLTATNLTYNSDGSVGFNGNNSVITAPNNSIFDTQSPSVEVWIKTNALSQNGFFFEKGTVNTQYSLFQEGSSIVWRQGSNSQYTTTANFINTSQWAHIVGTYAAGSRNTYINGVLVTSDTLNAPVGVNPSGITIGSYNSGGYFYNGSIGIVKVYNRAISAAEVRQNFNALKGRYGL
jgi:hypothetical protein